MFEQFPYADLQQLNLDWIIKIAKDFLDQYTHIQQLITDGETNLETLTTDGLEALQTKATELEGLLQTWYDTHSQDIAQQLADALQELQTEYGDLLDDFRQQIETKAADTLETIPADYTDLSNNVLELNSNFTQGLNLYNKIGTQINKALATGTGAERDLTGAYLSDYIEVDGSTEYYIGHSIGSPSSYPTLAVYAYDKSYIGQEFRGSVASFTYTTPANAKFIRVVWLVASGEDQRVERTPTFDNAVLNHFTLSPFASDKCRLFSDGQIIYNNVTGIINSTNNIVINFGSSIHSFGTSVNVGVGDILYFNSKTKTLHAETNFTVDPADYLISVLTANELAPAITPNNCALFAFNIFNYDEANNVFSVNVVSQPAFLVFNNYVYRLNTGTSISFNMSEDVCYVYYNTQTQTFIKSTDYGDLVRNRGFVVFNKYYWKHWCISSINTKMENASYKRAVCFGDSLTWYDGHAFDWGAEQGNICKGYETYLIQAFNMREVSNQGISGASTPQICSAVKSYTNIQNFDYIFIMSGDNDERLNVAIGAPAAIGSTFDTTTVYGSLQSAIEYLLTVKPTIRIILMTEPQGWIYRGTQYYSVDTDIPDAIRNVAGIYNIPVIDLWKESGINELNRDTFYNDPPTNNQYMFHPNNMCWEQLSRLIIKHFDVVK